MYVYLLVDDDGSALFIMQEVKESNDNSVFGEESDGELFLGLDPFNMQSPCQPIFGESSKYNPECLDILDFEMDDFKQLENM